MLTPRKTAGLSVRHTANVIAQAMDMSADGDKMQSLNRIVHQLTQEHSFPIDAARDAAALAIAELETPKFDVVFDLGASTDKCIFVNIDGARRALTAADIATHLEF